VTDNIIDMAVIARRAEVAVVTAMRSYRCTQSIDALGDGLPLVDILCSHAGHSVASGKQELDSLIDHVAGMVVADIMSGVTA